MQALDREGADTLSPPVVMRLCPYCKDDLRSELQVLCASCFTPHHRGCFSENGLCCLLGCGSRRSLALEAPAPDDTPNPVDVRRLLGLWLALLVAGLATGWLLETRQNAVLESFAWETIDRQRLARELQLRDLMTRIMKAQREYRRHDPNGDYAPSWAALAAVTSSLYVPGDFQVRICSTHGDPVPRYCAIVIPSPRTSTDAPPTVSAWSRVELSLALDENGVSVYRGGEETLALDEMNCSVVVSRPRARNRP